MAVATCHLWLLRVFSDFVRLTTAIASDCDFPAAGGEQNPKDPAILKILRRSKFALCSKFTIA